MKASRNDPCPCGSAQSATEYDLRMFLYDFLPAEGIPKPVAKHLTGSLRRLFRFYAEHQGIKYPWGEGVLSELDEVCAGAEDVRHVLEEIRQVVGMDVLIRALRPVAEVPGTPAGWGGWRRRRALPRARSIDTGRPGSPCCGMRWRA